MNNQEQNYGKKNLLIRLLTLGALSSCGNTKGDLDINVKKALMPMLLSSKAMSHPENTTATTFSLPTLTTHPMDTFKADKVENASTESTLISTSNSHTTLQEGIMHSTKTLEQAINKYSSKDNINQESETNKDLVGERYTSLLKNYEIIDECNIERCVRYNANAKAHSYICFTCLNEIIFDEYIDCDGVLLLNRLADRFGMDNILLRNIRGEGTFCIKFIVKNRIDLIRAAAKRADFDKLLSEADYHLVHTIIRHMGSNAIEFLKLIPNFLKKNINKSYKYGALSATTPLEYLYWNSYPIEVVKFLIDAGATVTKKFLQTYEWRYPKADGNILKLLQDTYAAQEETKRLEKLGNNSTDIL